MENARKFSRKREAIYAALRSTDTHPGAEWVYSRVKPDFPDLSLATVYRNLSLFREDGSAAVVATVQGQDRFDARTDPHPHFICDACGAVLDIHEPLNDGLDSQLENFAGGEAHWHEVIFHGVCRSCLEKRKKS